MNKLLFPYISADNPLIKKVEDDFESLSLISLDKELTSFYDTIYSKIYFPDPELINKISSLFSFYSGKISENRNENFLFDFYSGDSEESVSEILKELNSDAEIKDNDKLVMSGLFLKMAEKYEQDKLNIDLELYEIEKKEKNLFSNLLNTKNYDKKDMHKKKPDHEFSLEFVKKRINSWVDFFVSTGCVSFSWITDKKEYVDFLNEAGLELEKVKDLKLPASGSHCCVYESTADFQAFVNKKVKYITADKNLPEFKNKILTVFCLE
ncbi:MAG: hypothetical protein ACQEQS_02465 [Thermodesulfobacteriota bacterium]